MSAQIHRDIYKYRSVKITRNRLLKLKKAKIITGENFNILNRMVAFGISKNTAFEHIEVMDNASLWKKTYSPYHDLKLLEIWRRLETSPEIKNVYTENEYKNLNGKSFDTLRDSLGVLNPDGVMKVKIDSVSFMATLEYERSFKTKARYFELLKDYYDNSQIKAVFYICESKRLLRLISKTEKEFLTKGDKPKFFYCFSKDVFKSDQVIFKNINNEIVTLDLSDSSDDYLNYESLEVSHQNILKALDIINEKETSGSSLQMLTVPDT